MISHSEQGFPQSPQSFRNFSQALLSAYHETPDKESLHLLFSRKPDQHVTYRDLVKSSAGFTSALQSAGIAPNEVVILILQHGMDLVAAFFGAVLNGSIPAIMPFLTEKLQPDQYQSALAALFRITAPSAVVTYADFKEEVQTASLGTSVRNILIAEEISASHTPSIDTEVSGIEELRGFSHLPSDVAILQHSSGTTGLQKGVALSHQAVFNQLRHYAHALHLSPDDIIVSWLPLYHDMGLIAGFILPILLRVPLVLMSPFEWVRAPFRLLQAISAYRGTLCWMPNFAFNFLTQKVRDRDLVDVDLSSLRAVINCSEPMQWQSHAMFLERFQPYGLQSQAMATSYAMAENVFAVTQGGIDAPVTVDVIAAQPFTTRQLAQPSQEVSSADTDRQDITIKMLSAGMPITGVQLRILNPHGQALPERAIGEIALQSDCMLTGYYNRPDLTGKAFVDGWYLTGDLGYLADGELYVTGRKKDLIIVGGKNIYPQDLEALAGEIPEIYPGRVVAFGIFNPQSGTEDVVLIAEVENTSPKNSSEPEQDRQRELDRIAYAVRQRVARGSDVALRHVHLVERNWLIKTSSGKIARSSNKAKYLAEVSPPP